MKWAGVLVAAAFLLLAACGDEGSTTAEQTATEETGAAARGMAANKRTDADEGGDSKASGQNAGFETTITVGDSEFGEMLFDSNRQAIYIFENDPEGKSVCYGECAEAWPPVLTDGPPASGGGVDDSLLGTVERRDGELQVTYAGQPLYFYAHEKPGEVRCHNVNLNGGFWWVVGPDGERLA